LFSYGAGYLGGMTGVSPVTFIMGLLVWGPLAGLAIGAFIIGLLEVRRRLRGWD
jgi:hypothetical protein